MAGGAQLIGEAGSWNGHEWQYFRTPDGHLADLVEPFTNGRNPADIGYGQVRDGSEVEKPLLTSGDDLESIQRFAAGRSEYSAGEVVDYLLSGLSGTEYESRALELQTVGK